MNNAYRMVEIAKEKNNIQTDNALAIKCGFTRQNLNDWKTGRSEPKGTNLLKLMKAADLSVDDGLKLMQNGFINVSLLFVTSIGGIALLALFKNSVHCILCKIDNISDEWKNAANDEVVELENEVLLLA